MWRRSYRSGGSGAGLRKCQRALPWWGLTAPYTGDGQVIAIIDSGVDVEHEAFQGAVPTDALTEAKLSDLAGQLNAGSGALTAAELRVDDKFPFAYDYADRDTNAIPGPETGLDHGTHVAGIAAANSGDTIRGVAPDAQVVAMRSLTTSWARAGSPISLRQWRMR